VTNIIPISRYRKIDIPRSALARVEILKDGRLHLSLDARDEGVICDEKDLPIWFLNCFVDLRERVSDNERGTVSVPWGMKVSDNLIYISCGSC